MEKSPTVLDWLIAHFPQAKKTTLRDMVAQKRVTLNGMPVKTLKQPVSATDKVDVLDAGAGASRPVVLAEGLRIVHLDADVIVVEKPTGLLTATHDEEPRPTVLRILNEFLQQKNHKERAHLVHRIDKDASGLLVFARSLDALNDLKKQFFDHTITRRYDVVAHGTFKERSGRLEHQLTEDTRGLVKVTKDHKLGKDAVLDYETLTAGKETTHLRCTLYTGRKHQIRVQLAAVGHTVCGDPIYGKGDEPPFRLALHASHLTFKHPGTRRNVSFNAPPPGTFAHLVRSPAQDCIIPPPTR